MTIDTDNVIYIADTQNHRIQLFGCSDPDTDNDGVLDRNDSNPNDPYLCEDVDNDLCDDCAIGNDGFGPLPDNEPFNDGLDTDFDGICDLSDNCPNVFNPAQEDSDDDDNDGHDDDFDCRPTDDSLWSIPDSIIDLTISGNMPTIATWNAPTNTGGSETLLYDVITSDIPYDFSEAACMESNQTDFIAIDSADPPLSGEVIYYLIRVKNSCGSTIGKDSEELNRSGKDCP